MPHPRSILLLVGGLLVGPVTGLLKPDEVFGNVLTQVISLAVALVLFEGSLSL